MTTTTAPRTYGARGLSRSGAGWLLALLLGLGLAATVLFLLANLAAQTI